MTDQYILQYAMQYDELLLRLPARRIRVSHSNRYTLLSNVHQKLAMHSMTDAQSVQSNK